MQSIRDRGGIRRIWAVDDGERVRRDDLSHPLAESPDNLVWRGGTAHLTAGRNEIVAFQLILEAGGVGAEQVSLSLPGLMCGSHNITNQATADPYDYRGKHIELFTEHSLTVTSRTETHWHWSGPARAMDIRGEEYLGEMPDALIPFEAPSGLGGVPFDIAPDRNQAVWVDILVPRDAVPGRYTGDIEVTARGQCVARIPVALDVCAFALPDTTHFHNFFWGAAAGISDKHGVPVGSPEYDLLELRYHQMAHRHRLDLTFNVNLEGMRRHYGRYLTGEAYTTARGYAGPGEGLGHGTYSIGTYDAAKNPGASGFYPDTREGWWAAADAWVEWFEEHAPHVQYFRYLQDEPGYSPATSNEVYDRADWLHSNPGRGRSLRAFCTCQLVRDMVGHVDVWQFWEPVVRATAGEAGRNCDLGGFREFIRQQQAQGKLVGFYNGCRPYFGTVVVDSDAVDFRVTPWVAWKYGIDQYFLWYSNYYTQGERRINPYQDHHRIYRGQYTWGDGILFYPGEDVEFPQDSRRLAGPIASIRMKNWRRGQQDYEYLTLAEGAGLREEASAAVEVIVPAALGDVTADDQARWACRGHLYERQRQRLARLLGERMGSGAQSAGDTAR